jgi:ornithine carbamoyltransferase
VAINLKGRSFSKLDDFTPAEIGFLLGLSAELKAAKRAGAEVPRLTGKEIALLFEKDSTRTRSGFEVAAHDQGAHVTYMGPSGTHIGSTESIRDTARVLGRMYDGIEFRGFAQADLEELAKYAGVPVWNGLTNEAHPTQVLADFLTMQEHAGKPLGQVKFCFLGDAGYNMGDSLMIGAAKMGMDIRLAGPRSSWPSQARMDRALAVAAESGGRITVTEDARAAVQDCDFLYTDVWVSMGEPETLWAQRIQAMRPYQVTSALMAATGNPATKFMHCLPSLHNTDTTLGRHLHEQFGLEAMEVTDDVFESPASVVFDQAENRLHTIKAILVATLGG